MTEKTQSQKDAEAVRAMFDHGLNETVDPRQAAEAKKADILAKVRALMELASRNSTPPGEAEAARERADILMTKYALDSWLLKQEDDAPLAKPELRWFDFQWWASNPFKHQLWWMFAEMGKHCRCEVVSAKLKYDEGYRIPVVGLPSDLGWFDLLFTNVMLFMVERVDPVAKPGLSVNENMARMREAGMPWAEALNRLVRARIVKSIAEEEWEKEPYNIDIGRREKPNPTNRYRKDGRGQNKLYFSKRTYESTITNYRRWCSETGHEQSKVSQSTFRRNFANGFAAEVNDRLSKMNRNSKAAYDEQHEAGSAAVAIRDIRKVVEEEVYILFPDLRPHPSDCDRDDCHWCHDAKCRRSNCVARRDWRPVRTRGRAPKEEREDWAAIDAGRAAGQAVNLSNKPTDRIADNRTGLPHGNR